MKVIVDEILGSRTINLSSGGRATITKFRTDTGEVMETFSNVEQGVEYLGDVRENAFGKTFKVQRTSNGDATASTKKQPILPNRSGPDPIAMMIAYGKDVTVAMIEAGLIKEDADVQTAWRKYAALAKTLYDAECEP